MKMIKGHEVLYISAKGNLAVVYAMYDLGEKYKVYRRVRYGENRIWEYLIGFNTQGEALKYASQIIDVEFER